MTFGAVSLTTVTDALLLSFACASFQLIYLDLWTLLESVFFWRQTLHIRLSANPENSILTHIPTEIYSCDRGFHEIHCNAEKFRIAYNA